MKMRKFMNFYLVMKHCIYDTSFCDSKSYSHHVRGFTSSKMDFYKRNKNQMCALVYSEEKSPTKVEKKFTFFPAKKKVRLNPLRSGVKRSRKMFFFSPIQRNRKHTVYTSEVIDCIESNPNLCVRPVAYNQCNVSRYLPNFF